MKLGVEFDAGESLGLQIRTAANVAALTPSVTRSALVFF
jgi:hypothetical protein